MTPTNLPLQPAAPGAPAAPAQQASASAVPADGAQTTDFLLMLGQLVAASVPQATPAVGIAQPAVATSGAAKKDEIDPEDLLAMLAMPMPSAPIPAEVILGEPQQSLPMLGTIEGVLQTAAEQIAQVQVSSITGDDKALSEAPAADMPDPTVLPTPLREAAQPAAVPHTHEVSLPVHTPVGNAAWADEIGARVLMMSEQQGNHTASLRLTPEHLGPLEISISIQDDKASVWFGAAHADTRAAIETALPRLREMFAAQGLSLTDAGVFREPPRQQQSALPTTGTGESASAEDAPAVLAARIRLGLVDAYA